MKPSNFRFSNIYVVDYCITVAGTKLLENTVKKLNFAHFVCSHGVNLKEKPFFAASIPIYHIKSKKNKFYSPIFLRNRAITTVLNDSKIQKRRCADFCVLTANEQVSSVNK